MKVSPKELDRISLPHTSVARVTHTFRPNAQISDLSNRRISYMHNRLISDQCWLSICCVCHWLTSDKAAPKQCLVANLVVYLIFVKTLQSINMKQHGGLVAIVSHQGPGFNPQFGSGLSVWSFMFSSCTVCFLQALQFPATVQKPAC